MTVYVVKDSADLILGVFSNCGLAEICVKNDAQDRHIRHDPSYATIIPCILDGIADSPYHRIA